MHACTEVASPASANGTKTHPSFRVERWPAWEGVGDIDIDTGMWRKLPPEYRRLFDHSDFLELDWANVLVAGGLSHYTLWQRVVETGEFRTLCWKTTPDSGRISHTRTERPDCASSYNEKPVNVVYIGLGTRGLSVLTREDRRDAPFPIEGKYDPAISRSDTQTNCQTAYESAARKSTRRGARALVEHIKTNGLKIRFDFYVHEFLRSIDRHYIAS